MKILRVDVEHINGSSYVFDDVRDVGFSDDGNLALITHGPDETTFMPVANIVQLSISSEDVEKEIEMVEGEEESE